MNKLSKEEQVRVVACLVEGNSLRATVRMTGIHRTTIQKLLVELGAACSAYQDKVFRNLKCKRVQCDEIWSFVIALSSLVIATSLTGSRSKRYFFF